MPVNGETGEALGVQTTSITNKTSGLKRELEFRDIFFLSLGGQAPFLSMLTYATAVLLLALYFSPIVVLIGTAVVLINGIVVYYLSKKHTESGGYFNYAFKLLSKRFGFETGWIYVFYSILYAGGYLIGSAFVLSYIVGIPAPVAFTIVFIPTSLFLIFGIKPSKHYAVFAGAIEMVVLVTVIIVSLFISHFVLYNPVSNVPSASVIFLGILFAIGIPTGYGAITPMSGETKNAHKNVGRAALMVIVIGGLLEALVLYGLVDVGITTHSFSAMISSNIPVITVMRSFLGNYSVPLFLFAGVNDGILGSLAFLTAASRVVYSMSSNKIIHPFFSRISNRSSTPTTAVITVILVSGIILIPAVLTINVFVLFLFLGSIAGLANLAVHLTSNLSLLSESLKSAVRSVRRIGVSLTAIALSGFVLIYSLIGSTDEIILIFMGYIITGFVVLEVIDMRRLGSKRTTSY
jgi:amino acid transporter